MTKSNNPKNLAAQELSKLAVKARKSNPNYLRLQKKAGDKGRQTQIKGRILKAVKYLKKHGYKLDGNLIKI